ncbi:hypothetical protein ACJX0J_014269 [Zea mays]
MDASVGELGKKGHQSLLLLNELSQHAALLGNIGSLYNERYLQKDEYISKEDPETGYDWCLLKNEHEKPHFKGAIGAIDGTHYLLILDMSFEDHAHDGDQEIEGENESFAMNNFMLFLLHTNSKVNYHIKESECLIQMMKKMIGKFDVGKTIFFHFLNHQSFISLETFSLGVIQIL